MILSVYGSMSCIYSIVTEFRQIEAMFESANKRNAVIFKSRFPYSLSSPVMLKRMWLYEACVQKLNIITKPPVRI